MATEVTPEHVKSYAPEFESVADARVELMLEYAENFLSESKWKTKYKMGKILMTCHLLAIGDREGSAGAIASESIGGMSVSYATPDTNEALNSTSHGQMFLKLRKSIATSPIVV